MTHTEDGSAASASFDLTGRVVVVTGGGGGLGRAFCRAVARHGAAVACVDRDLRGIEETLDVVAGYGGESLAVVADMTDSVQVDGSVEQVLAAFGRIDTLIANAGITSDAVPLHETSPTDWEHMIRTNLTSQFLAMRAVLPTMMKQLSGTIINIASVGALGGNRIAPAAYGASKAAVIALCKYAAVQYGAYGIRANCILPGIHITDFGMPEGESAKVERVTFLEEFAARSLPLGRVAYPHELEGLVVLLASDASSYITGATFIQDGGGTAQV
ncbi:MAG: SDR family NAD(P)-dependent oxidoreductase [Thermoleophilia bacterium]|jgi:3-oxoacyl-[acyl-carrier protein] reductase